ncbi:MAG: FMN-binding protein, partial [Clostridia bacterium]|nr:FMN-binding protein [Clostridia bacterium]
AGGYGGDVSVMTGRDAEGKITKIEILACNDETPGLGQNSKTPKFKDQYSGLEGEIEVIKNAQPVGSQIQAITSATITSKAVTSAVNQTLDIYNAIAGGEK